MTESEAIQRLQQTLRHIEPVHPYPPRPHHPQILPSIIQGVTSPPLRQITLGDLLDEQAAIRGDSECLVVPWTGTRWTYSQLQTESMQLSRAMFSMGIRAGDRVGILAGNCEQYVSLFFAAGYLGAILVVLNNTYTTTEVKYALEHSECKILFASKSFPRIDRRPLLEELTPRPQDSGTAKMLQNVVVIRGNLEGFDTYDHLLEMSSISSEEGWLEARRKVDSHDVCNLQYTSGSTGNPKAAMLTHHNLINNALSIGDRMAFTPSDILCCPPPLFHCFGLVLGVLAIITHGARIVLPSEAFDARAVLHALADEKCTALHGVPAMFEDVLKVPCPAGWSCENLRTGIIAGSPVPKSLMKRLLDDLHMHQYTSSYGLTEASPTCFNAHHTDTISTRLETVGALMPHMQAKIISRDGQIVPMGERGELCIAGYNLQIGYWKNDAKTAEVMKRDRNGVLWLHTGDEASFVVGEDGVTRAKITGRFKDIIIRGGENIYPLEIEDRLVLHPSISRAMVVGLHHEKYIEVVGVFLQSASGLREEDKPSVEQLRDWVRMTLGRHKAPAHVFWLGEDGVPDIPPMTGSGKIKKHVLRDWGNRLLLARPEKLEEAPEIREM